MKTGYKILASAIFSLSAFTAVADPIDDQIKAAKNDAIKQSNNYTNREIKNNNLTINKDINQAADKTLTSSKAYSDNQLAKTTTQLQNNIYSTAIQSMQTSTNYTDKVAKELETTISDTKTDAVKTSNDYTDSKVSGINTSIDNAKTEAVVASNSYTDNKVSNIHSSIDDSRKQAISSSQNYTNARFTELETSMNSRFNSVEQQMNKNADRANAGIASVAAMANIPYTDNTRFSMGLGAGNYRNGNAMAFGGQLRLENNVNLRTSVSWNSEDSAVYGAGVAFGF